MKVSAKALAKTRDWFFSKKGFLFDLDGTLYLGTKLLEGSQELISKLRDENKAIYFFTNNSSRSAEDYLKKLSEFGFKPSLDEIIMSTHSLIRYLQRQKINSVYLLGTPSMEAMLKSFGISNTYDGAEALVVGFDKTLTYEKLKKAVEILERGAPFIVTHPDLYCPTNYGREPDCGAMAKLLEVVTEIPPKITLGKPHRSMIEIALERSGLKKKDMVLIGDRLSTDIQMARESGIDSLLVLTGETTAKKVKSSRIKSTHVLGAASDLIS